MWTGGIFDPIHLLFGGAPVTANFVISIIDNQNKKKRIVWVIGECVKIIQLLLHLTDYVKDIVYSLKCDNLYFQLIFDIKVLTYSVFGFSVYISLSLSKGQLISEWNFGAIKSPKKPTKS